MFRSRVNFLVFLSFLYLSNAAYITQTWNIKWQYLAPDGFYRGVITINDQFPAPTIRCMKGDTINITVVNHLLDSTVAVHWHGISQHGSPYMDGASMITQFPIVPMQSFRYEFTADEAGTFWYHAHTPMQYLDGLSGALIVEDPNEIKSWSREEVIILQEWYHEPGLTMAAAGWWSDEEPWRHLPAASTLIHGKGRANCSALYPAPPASWRCARQPSPVYSLSISPGEKILLRIIGGMSEDPMRFSIDGHDLTVIRFQKSYMTPVAVKSIDLHAGYRYDVIVSGIPNPAPGYAVKINAWLMFGPAVRCNNSCFQNKGFGWLQYPNNVNSNGNTESTLLSSTTLTLSAASFNAYISADPNHIEVPPPPTIFWDVNFNQSVYYDPSKPQNGLTPLFTFNGLLFNVPARPTIMEIYEDNRFSWPIESLIWSAPLGSVFDLYFKNFDINDHPVHLHGYNFWILSVGDTVDRNFPPNPQLNLANPIRGDTVIVPAKGWAYLRVHANNPGIWTFHCHVDSHNSPNAHHGMIMAFAVGVDTLAQTYPLPLNFPKIIGDVYQGHHVESTKIQSPSAPNIADGSPAIPILVILVIVLLCAIIFILVAQWRANASRKEIESLDAGKKSYQQMTD